MEENKENKEKLTLAAYFENTKADNSRRVIVNGGETVVAILLHKFAPKVCPVSKGNSGNASLISNSVSLWIGQFKKSVTSSGSSGVQLPVSFKKKEGDQALLPDGLLQTFEVKNYSHIFVSTLKIDPSLSKGDIVCVRGLSAVAVCKEGEYSYLLNASMVDRTDMNQIVFCRNLITRPPPIILPDKCLMIIYLSLRMPEKRMLN
jgi:hypothetical protein